MTRVHALQGQSSGGAAPTISVVIAHLDQNDLLAECLASLMAGTRKPDEIIVVDNGSTDRPDAVCAAYPMVRLLHEPVPGPGPARSTGARTATGGIIAFTDADCRVDDGWLLAVARAFSDPSVQIAGGDVRIAPVDPARMTMVEAYESLFAFRAARYIRRKGFALTCNLAVRRSAFATVGDFAGLDRAEDVDWGRRAGALGLSILYCPDMLVLHPARPSLASLRDKWGRQIAHAYRGLGPKLTDRTFWLLRSLAMGPSPLAALPRIAFSRRIRGVRARVLAFACLCHIRWYRGRVMLWLLAGGDPSRLLARWNPRAGRGA